MLVLWILALMVEVEVNNINIMNDMYLVYINYLGVGFESLPEYEFYFSDSLYTDIEGDNWDVYPASSGKPTIPNEGRIVYISSVFIEEPILLIQKNHSFSMYDAIDGIVALAWEDIRNSDYYPENRMVFKYGDKKSDIEMLLLSREIIMKEKFNSNGRKEYSNS